MKQIQLYTKLSERFPNIALGGSLVLQQFGLLSRPVGDLDINTTDTNHDFLKFCTTLSHLQPTSQRNYYGIEKEDHEGNKIKHIPFMLDGIKVCVFVTTKQHFEHITRNGFTNLGYIISAKEYYAKKGINRTSSKHLLDLEEIHKNLDEKPLLKMLLNKNNLYEYQTKSKIEFDPF